jgi:hypothetical protein
VRQRSYPVMVKNGIVFAYLGEGAAPAFPEFDCFLAPGTHAFAFKGLIDCNWLQALEVGIDPAHASWLHKYFEDEDTAGSYGKQFRGRPADSEMPISKVLREYDADAIEEVYSDGLLNVMEAPEFAQSEKLRRVFNALENRVYLGQLVGSVAGAGQVQVFIGHENQPIDMRDVSLVLAPYGRPGQAIGVVGVLGPTRMSYSQAIGTVRFVSGLMNELVDHLYA